MVPFSANTATKDESERARIELYYSLVLKREAQRSLLKDNFFMLLSHRASLERATKTPGCFQHKGPLIG